MIDVILIWVIMFVITIIFLSIAWEYIPDGFKKILKKMLNKLLDKRRKNKNGR